ncbi:flavodoxin family protein [Lachnobacterium bovis]|uniref:NADPH-dependent FMN reductase n=1 Tax=Lachnobacterium bovis TaxID=140626 RepID=A0A1H9U7G9_9FIRM|nr:flavodoxin family protein [Lachnobacterium bovis]SES05178.1 NADPH-dependent FMN reductase [Lachnobacterium bovis]
MKKIVILSTSPRKNSNSNALAEKFAKGAKEAGNEVEIISVIGKKIEFCRGCFACQKTGQCVIKDGLNALIKPVLRAMYFVEV